jgi:hypothetical protein
VLADSAEGTGGAESVWNRSRWSGCITAALRFRRYFTNDGEITTKLADAGQATTGALLSAPG